VKHGFLLPVYRHGKTAGPLAEKLAAFGLPVIVVDDGNDAETKALLVSWAAKIPEIVLIRLEKNTGKGGAATEGFKVAARLGLTHLLQIDADGQHDAGMAVFFLDESRKHPDKVICAYPVFEETAPKARVVGRSVSNFWAAVVTLNGGLKDVLCGFRVYPVEAAVGITKNPFIDKRMGFDAEILIRLYWRGIRPVFYPVKVVYPQDGISNFRLVKDNVRISFMFTRLCIGMLLRFPLLVFMRLHGEEQNG
jgi:glycosyltransferase involved in cell wall biosynthesis